METIQHSRIDILSIRILRHLFMASVGLWRRVRCSSFGRNARIARTPDRSAFTESVEQALPDQAALWGYHIPGHLFEQIPTGPIPTDHYPLGFHDRRALLGGLGSKQLGRS